MKNWNRKQGQESQSKFRRSRELDKIKRIRARLKPLDRLEIRRVYLEAFVIY